MANVCFKRLVTRCVITTCVVVPGSWPLRACAGPPCKVTIDQVGHWDQDQDLNSPYADIWADGNVVYLSQFGDNKVHFIDITDPTNPTKIIEWVVGAPNQGSSAQDVKVANGLLFIGLESGGNDGVEIVDVRDPFNPQHLTFINAPGIDDIHNTFYDNGFLYLADSSTPVVAIVDLTFYDPDNPPATIANNLWLLNVGTSFVHDITVQNGRLYACAWDSGLWVYDVSNVALEQPTLLGVGCGISTHAVWLSGNGRWAVVGEERQGGPVKLYEIVPNGPNVDVILRDVVTLSTTDSFSSHNPIVDGTRVYVSWYQAGMRILEIDEATATLVDVASFDTFPGGVGGFDGAWGVYPFLGNDRIVVSDLATGLYVLKTNELPLSLTYPNGLVTGVDPDAGAALTVKVSAKLDSPDPDTAKLFVRNSIDGGGFAEIPLVSIGGDLFEADLPRAPCGSIVSYYVSVDTLGGQTVLDPCGAPLETFSAQVFSGLIIVFADDFETNQGWASAAIGDNATTGIWTRVDPICTGAQPEDDHTSDPGTMCFVTGQGSFGGSIGENDVDGGTTTLVSPTIDASGGDAVIGYWRWYANTGGANPNDDVFVIDISNDDGGSWTNIETIGPVDAKTSGGWFYNELLISDFVTPTSQVKMRFVASDLGAGSIVEAAVDDFVVFFRECVPNPLCFNGVLDPGEDRIDCGGACPACECLNSIECEDREFCNGDETCDAFGTCVAGIAPCPSQLCDELNDLCNNCQTDADCSDDDVCTQDRCIAGSCEHTGKTYGDVDNDGDVDIFDLFCILSCSIGDFSECSFEKCDLEPCEGDGSADLFDLFAVLNAFGGDDPCCGG